MTYEYSSCCRTNQQKSWTFNKRHSTLLLIYCQFNKFDHVEFNFVASVYQALDCVVPCVCIILHRGRFWAKSAASWSVRWWYFCWAMWCVDVLIVFSRPSERRLTGSSPLCQHLLPHPATVQPVHRWRQNLSCSWSPGLEQSATGGHISAITGHLSQASEDSSVHRVIFEHTTIVTD